MQSPTEPVQRLLSALETSLDGTGWTQELMDHAQKRVQENEIAQQSDDKRRSGRGHSTRYHRQEELLKEIVTASRPSAKESVNGSSEVGRGLVPRGGDTLRISQHVVDAAVQLLKDELGQLCEVNDDKYVDWRTNL